MDFILDQRLADSAYFIADLPLSRLCLKNNSVYRWICLVPRRADIREIYELAIEDQSQLIREIAWAGRMLKSLYKADKINTAAYGNMVPQLHIHIFARHTTDPAWPKPVWSVQTDEIPYTEAVKATEIARIKEYLGSGTI